MRRLALAFAFAAACSPANNPAVDGAADASCAAPDVLRYEQPGCDAQPLCGSPVEDMCLAMACSCAGKVIGGCDYFGEPWARKVVSPGARVGDDCALDAM